MIDWTADLLDPIYDGLGVPAVLTLASGAQHPVTAIDATEGVRAGDRIEVPTVEPAAYLRVAELAALGLSALDLDDGTIALNGVIWRISNSEPRPTPGGERAGEIVLSLYRDPDAAEPQTETGT